MSDRHRGRRVSLWLPDQEATELERLRDELATSTGRATFTRVIRQALDALSLEVFESAGDDARPPRGRTS